jgi:hypothetical protein
MIRADGHQRMQEVVGEDGLSFIGEEHLVYLFQHGMRPLVAPGIEATF